MTSFARIADDLEVAYDAAGDGPPLLFLHGLQGGRRMLADFAASLASSFRVITFDQRDSGETRNVPRAYDVAQLADDAAALIRVLGLERVHVLGTSFGGRLAQVLAIRHPELVDRLILNATWPMPRSIAAVNPEGSERFARIRDALPDSANELAEMFVPKSFLDAHPELRARLIAMPDAPDRAARRTQAAATVHGDATSIVAPTLLIAGEVDEVVPAAATLGMAQLIPDARSACLSGVGHVAYLQSPAPLAELVRSFLI